MFNPLYFLFLILSRAFFSRVDPSRPYATTATNADNRLFDREENQRTEQTCLLAALHILRRPQRRPGRSFHHFASDSEPTG